MKFPYHFCFFVIATVICSPLRGQEVAPKSYVCYRAPEPIRTDGELTEISWSKAQWTDLFVDIEGESKPRPRFLTRVKMLWDSTYLYIAAELQERDVWATLLQRDTVIFRDNDFEVFIDPDGDTHQYYEFEMNAFNTVWDLLLIKPYRDGGPPVNGWDIKGLKTSVSVRGTINQPGDVDSGWTVELAFPWKALKECAHRDAPPNEGDQWRINFSRVEWKVHSENGNYVKEINPANGKPLAEDNWVWSPQGLVDMHYPEMWGFIQFSDKEVGNGQERFVRHPEEGAKWALRKLYYKQRDFFGKFGHYAASTEVLGLSNEKVDGYSWPPDIECTQSLYEAVIHSLNGKEHWHISNNGRIWER